MRLCEWLATLGMLALPPGIVAAAPLPPTDGIVSYAVVDQDLRDVLTEVGRQYGLRVTVSEAVHGRVHGRLPSDHFEAVLNRLARTYGFDWYFDGGTMWISASSEEESKILSLTRVDPSQLARSLDTLGISDARWPLRVAGDAKVVIVGGPPHYVQMVEQTTAVLEQHADQGSKVGVFRGSVSGR